MQVQVQVHGRFMEGSSDLSSTVITSSTSFVEPPSARRRSAMGLTRIVSSGTKCSGAHFFSLRYLMHSIAVASSSTTIAWKVHGRFMEG